MKTLFALIAAVALAVPVFAQTPIGMKPKTALSPTGYPYGSGDLVGHGGAGPYNQSAFLSGSSPDSINWVVPVLIFWGSGFSTDLVNGVTDLANGWGSFYTGSGYADFSHEDLLTQYEHTPPSGWTKLPLWEWGASDYIYFDTTHPLPTVDPATHPNVLQNELRALFTAGVIPTVHGTSNTNFIYVVIVPNNPGNQAARCAFHNVYLNNANNPFPAIYVPNVDDVAGCEGLPDFTHNSYSVLTQSTANVLSHEFAETITDWTPGAGWTDSVGEEVADKCDFVFLSPVQNGGPTVWWLQALYSNAVHDCVE